MKSSDPNSRLDPLDTFKSPSFLVDLAILAFGSGLTVVATRLSGRLFYLAGFGKITEGVGVFGNVLFMLSALVLTTLLVVLRTFSLRPEKHVVQKLIRFTFPFVVIVLWLGLQEPGYIAFTRGFLDKLRTDVSADQLQTWAVRVLSDHPSQRADIPLPMEQYPDLVRNIRKETPADIRIMGNRDEGQRHVDIMWGGGFAGWGLRIGAPQFRMKSDRFIYSLEWRPGMYVCHSKS